ncbi:MULTISPECIES: GerMN domain-containing protein [Paenibacillus]|uniref:GerMN domain-containing protein n=1 Tax=Paenibacillus violae TaxID=3077234 RepID=A0ABU3R6Z3_9BACL|nr:MULTISPECIES: GerMN domain-containing protein [Paenibacillus]MDU0200038.1 GerMN domain-containing protein [Paenibacillus sp. PFR10]MEC0269878.1 GerMN domain-containing protein [Paenibacillus anseongense]
MTQTRRFIQGALLVSAITLSITACGQKNQLVSGSAPQTSTNPISTSTVQSPAPTVAATPTPEPELHKKIKAYYSDQDEMKLVEKEVTISYKKDADVYGAALNALKKSDDPKAIPLFDDLKFTSSAFDKTKGELKVDLTFGPKTQLGAPGEEMFLQALKKTVFQFPEVKALYVLKDGKQVDSLMGHLELPYPIKRPN